MDEHRQSDEQSLKLSCGRWIQPAHSAYCLRNERQVRPKLQVGVIPTRPITDQEGQVGEQ
jgi:hypothetical protein